MIAMTFFSASVQKLGLTRALTCFVLLLGLPASLTAGALENYVGQTDTNYTWKRVSQRQSDGFTVSHLELTSQKWREHVWHHHMQVVRPAKVRNPGIGFLFITGDGEGTRYLDTLKTLAGRAGAVAAVISKVPNQPLYNGRKEDALVAYTFVKYAETGDESWPLLFPMVKSAVRAMDAVQAFVEQESKQKIEKFVVSGASKRGWTTWLAGAVDPRVQAIAPMVIDMLNMKVQTQWAEKVYGKQSEKIHDYTEHGLHEKQDEPPIARLRSWVDPYAYRERYTMPKLLLLGSNDRYWTVDSLRHYWNDLPEPKLIFQTPNAGHDLGGGREATQTLAAFFQMIADGQELPKMQWQLKDVSKDKAELSVKVDQRAKMIRLWTADSSDRDLRDDRWTSRELKIQPGSSQASAEIQTPKHGYRAYMAELVLTSPTGHEYKLSTEARVTPDNIK
jgi:PhoPQ-activated pathogenicity-related protein